MAYVLLCLLNASFSLQSAGVELLLNVAWVVTSGVLIGLWIMCLRRQNANRYGVLLAGISLALLIFILLPAISMTDDRLAMQSPAELEHSLRRDDSSYADILIAPAPLATLEGSSLVLPADDVIRVRPSSTVLIIGQTLAGKRDTRAVRPPPSISIYFA